MASGIYQWAVLQKAQGVWLDKAFPRPTLTFILTVVALQVMNTSIGDAIASANLVLPGDGPTATDRGREVSTRDLLPALPALVIRYQFRI